MKKTNKEEFFVGDFITTLHNPQDSVIGGINGIILSKVGSLFLCRLPDNAPHCDKFGGMRTKCGIYLLASEMKLNN